MNCYKLEIVQEFNNTFAMFIDMGRATSMQNNITERLVERYHHKANVCEDQFALGRRQSLQRKER